MSARRKPTKAAASAPPVLEEPTSEPAPAEAVAEEAPVEAQATVEPDPAPAAAPTEASRLVCVICGKRAVYETDGRATSKRAYCRRDLPANVTKAMVTEYELLSRQ